MNFFLQLLTNLSGAFNFPEITGLLNNLIKGIFGWLLIRISWNIGLRLT